jgi:hypothetical protein
LLIFLRPDGVLVLSIINWELRLVTKKENREIYDLGVVHRVNTTSFTSALVTSKRSLLDRLILSEFFTMADSQSK